MCNKLINRKENKINMIQSIILELLKLVDNETNLIDDFEERQLFKDLIIELNMIYHDIRYCSRKDCPCQPETKMKKILQIDSIRNLIREYCPTHVIHDLNKLIKEN